MIRLLNFHSGGAEGICHRPSRCHATILIEHRSRIEGFSNENFLALKHAPETWPGILPANIAYCRDLRKICSDRAGKVHCLPGTAGLSQAISNGSFVVISAAAVP